MIIPLCPVLFPGSADLKTKKKRERNRKQNIVVVVFFFLLKMKKSADSGVKTLKLNVQMSVCEIV